MLRAKNYNQKRGSKLNWQFESQSLKPKKQRLIDFDENV
jgi:hypothetical protein